MNGVWIVLKERYTVKRFIYFSAIDVLDSYFSKEEENVILVF